MTGGCNIGIRGTVLASTCWSGKRNLKIPSFSDWKVLLTPALVIIRQKVFVESQNPGALLGYANKDSG